MQKHKESKVLRRGKGLETAQWESKATCCLQWIFVTIHGFCWSIRGWGGFVSVSPSSPALSSASAASRTIAPAPSPKRMHEFRSSQSTHRDKASAPITKLFLVHIFRRRNENKRQQVRKHYNRRKTAVLELYGTRCTRFIFDTP